MQGMAGEGAGDIADTSFGYHHALVLFQAEGYQGGASYQETLTMHDQIRSQVDAANHQIKELQVGR